jgi:LmbE family N-acetylglucosaminyl deacetylase
VDIDEGKGMNPIKRILLQRRAVDNHLRKRSGWPVVMDCPSGNDILVIAPHWDDPIIACYGTLLHATRKDKRVSIYYFDNGPRVVPFKVLPRLESNSWNAFDVIMISALWDEDVKHRVTASIIPETFLGEVWSYQVYDTIGNVVVDIGDVAKEKEVALGIIHTYETDRDWIHYTKGKDAFASRHLHRPDARYAETFFVTKEYGRFLEEVTRW